MYPRNSASPQRLAVGAVIQISDGAVQTTGITITVRGQGGAEAAGANSAVVGASGIVYYTPTQAETNFESFVVIASKASCIPVAITVVTSASSTSGQVQTDSTTNTAIRTEINTNGNHIKLNASTRYTNTGGSDGYDDVTAVEN